MTRFHNAIIDDQWMDIHKGVFVPDAIACRRSFDNGDDSGGSSSSPEDALARLVEREEAEREAEEASSR